MMPMILILISLCSLAFGQQKQVPTKPQAPGRTSGTGPDSPLIKMLEERMGSVVTVEVNPEGAKASPIIGFTPGQTKEIPLPKPKPYENSFFTTKTGASGSGFIIRSANVDYVVTNAHVVRDINLVKIVVISSAGKRYAMEFVGADSIRDIAVLKFVDRPASEMIPASFRLEPVRVGERVYALGTPLGRYPSSVSDGIVSGVNRQSVGTSAGYIQSTAALSPGNSGGPLVDASGRVVGVNTWRAVDSNTSISQLQLNFSLNGKLASDTVDQIIKNKRVIRGSLGLLIAEPVTDEVAFIIAYAHEDLPGEISKKLTGRQLVSLDGDELQNSVQLFGLLDAVQPNQSVKLGLGATATEAAEVVTIMSSELTDKRLELMARAYLEAILGLKATQQGDALQIELSKSKFCEPVQFELKELLGKLDPEKREVVTAEFKSTIAGSLGVKDGKPVLNGDDLYGIYKTRDLYLLVRAKSNQGLLTFMFEDQSKSYALILVPMVEGERVQFLIH